MLASSTAWKVSAMASVRFYWGKLVLEVRAPLRTSAARDSFVVQPVMGLIAARLAILRRLALRVLNVGIGKGLRPMEVLVWPWS